MNLFNGTPCMPWPGKLDKEGYGRVRIRRNGIQVSIQAHRAVYTNIVGPIPRELVLDHLCRNPSCVNPAHLEPVTNRQNILRGIGPCAVNAKKTHCKRGHLLSDGNIMGGKSAARGHRICKECNRIRALAFYYKYKGTK